MFSICNPITSSLKLIKYFAYYDLSRVSCKMHNEKKRFKYLVLKLLVLMYILLRRIITLRQLIKKTHDNKNAFCDFTMSHHDAALPRGLARSVTRKTPDMVCCFCCSPSSRQAPAHRHHVHPCCISGITM